METQKNENNIVLEMKRLLGRMMVQVDYMYRNDREMSRLDLDIMMERTREFYELLCDYQSDGVTKEAVENVEANHDSTDIEINEGGELINRDVEFEIETPAEVLEEPEQEPEQEPEVVEEEEKQEEEPVNEEERPDDEDEEDWEDEDDEMFHVESVEEMQETLVEAEDSEDVTPEEPEDNSLAARLQRTPVDDIRMALGINDKVMIINDLFKGSVERYNKSVDALNDFPTLSGAKVYMSELQIELQWDTESQAYKMLNDIVERRFI